MNITDQDHEEIVAIQFGQDILFGMSAVDEVRRTQNYTQLIPRSTFKFMAEIELDPRWAEYAEYPTIFSLKQLREWEGK